MATKGTLNTGLRRLALGLALSGTFVAACTPPPPPPAPSTTGHSRAGTPAPAQPPGGAMSGPRSDLARCAPTRSSPRYVGIESVDPATARVQAIKSAAVTRPLDGNRAGVIVTTSDGTSRPEFTEVQGVDSASTARLALEAVDAAAESGDRILGVEANQPVLTTSGSAAKAAANAPANAAANATADPRRSDQWALDQFPFESAAQRSMCWGVVVAVIDSGIDHLHPDLSRVVSAREDLSGDRWGTSGVHGTHVGGIIGANPDNGIGITGAAPYVRLLDVKVLRTDGTGSVAELAQGIRWAVDHGADVLNLSLSYELESPAVASSIEYARSMGVLVVAAAGNNGESGNTPNQLAQLDWPIAVASTGANGSVSAFSTRAPYVDVAAPGENIVSTVPMTGGSLGYGMMSGTSMAAPMVSALAVLHLRHSPSLTAEQLRATIIGDAVDAGPTGWDEGYGHGLIGLDSLIGTG